MNPTSQIVGTTQFFVCDLTKSLSPQYVVTRDITSCVVLLLRQLDSKQKCSCFGLAHLNVVNVAWLDVATENIKVFLQAYEKIGGNIALTSFDLLGGLENDPNMVRETIRLTIQLATLEKIQSSKLKVNVSPTFFIHGTQDEFKNHGNGEVMTIACDQKQIYTRKLIFKEGKIIKEEFWPLESTVLQDGNRQKIALVDEKEYRRLKQKTHDCILEINTLNAKDLNPDSFGYEQERDRIKKKYCYLENVSKN